MTKTVYFTSRKSGEKKCLRQQNLVMKQQGNKKNDKKRESSTCKYNLDKST